MHYLWILFFVYLLGAVAALAASTNSGSWQRVSDSQGLVFRSPWSHTVGGTMIALFFIAGGLFPIYVHSQVKPPGPVLLSIWFIITAGPALLLLWLCSPQELRINLQERTYCYTRFRLIADYKNKTGSLIDFSGVCAIPTGTLLLVFQKKRGLLYGIILGRFKNGPQSLEQAKEFSAATGLSLVSVPWRKGQSFVA